MKGTHGSSLPSGVFLGLLAWPPFGLSDLGAGSGIAVALSLTRIKYDEFQ